MKRELLRLMTREVDDYSLAQLARAIAFAPRRSGVHVWRTFVSTRDLVVVREDATQRIRMRPQALAR